MAKNSVSFQQLVQFIADYGKDYGIDVKSIAYVGVSTVLEGINSQLDSVSMEGNQDPVARMHDYFGDGAFDHAFDVAWANDSASDE